MNISRKLPMHTHTFLHVGCGRQNPLRLPAFFQQSHWREVRLDVDPQVAPDVIASITDLSMFREGCLDAIWSSHNLEHLHAFEVNQALLEFRRVLKPNGFLFLTLPDIKAIARYLVIGGLQDVLYQSAAGPITPLDILFGHQESLRAGNSHMAHRTAFTAESLGQALVDAGFANARIFEGRHWDLWAIATMPGTPDSIFAQLMDATG